MAGGLEETPVLLGPNPGAPENVNPPVLALVEPHEVSHAVASPQDMFDTPTKPHSSAELGAGEIFKQCLAVVTQL